MNRLTCSINFLPKTDVLICGGGLNGILIALELKKQGKRCVIACREASPWYELSAALQTWLPLSVWNQLPTSVSLPLNSSIKWKNENFIFFHSMKAIVIIEDLLLDSGVEIFYMCEPSASIQLADGTQRVLLAGKFGLLGIESSVVIDNTPYWTIYNNNVFKSTSTSWISGVVPKKVRYIAHLQQKYSGTIALNGLEGISGTVTGYDSFALFQIEVKEEDQSIFEHSLLIKKLQNYINCAIVQLANSGIFISVFRNADIFLIENIVTSEINKNEIIPVPALTEKLCDLSFVLDAIEKRKIIVREAEKTHHKNPSEHLTTDGKYSFCDPIFREPNLLEKLIEIDPIPVCESAEVLIAGGGTSGAAAAYYAAKHNLDAICVEPRAELGGTNTTGGVSKLWYGNFPPAVTDYYYKIFEVEEREQIRGINRILNDFGMKYYPGITVCGVITNSNKLTHVIVATAKGLAAIQAEYFIDATGDGDLAAWSSCPYTYGNGHDESTLWCSFGTFGKGKDEGSRHFLTICDQRSVRDTARALIVNRRNPGIFGDLEYPLFLPASRESRHICGRHTVTYLDLLMGKWVEDCVQVFRSNVDIKGMPAGNEVFCGFIEKDWTENFICNIPYSALINDTISNLIVVGKAYSIDHDAFSMARMQADLAGLGMTAVAAVLCAKIQSKPLNAIDISPLQKTLIEDGLLYPGDLFRNSANREVPGERELYMLIHRLSTGPVTLPDIATLISGGIVAQKILERKTSYAKNLETFGRILGYLGSKKSGEILVPLLEGVIESGEYAGTSSSKIIKNLPDHGWSPQPVYWLQSLALSGDDRIYPFLEQIAEIEPDETVCDYRYMWVHAIAWCCEKMVSHRCVPVLKKMLRKKVFFAKTICPDRDLREFTNIISERWAYLEFCLAKALFLCGDEEGRKILLRISGDARLFLSRSASIVIENNQFAI